MAGEPMDPPREEEPLTGDPNVPIDFTTFVLSLSSNAAFHLGLVPHPKSDHTCRNLPMARQTIDILGVLQAKTAGNLTGDEERLLGEIIYNLRMEYLRAAEECKRSSRENA
jgi:hypothetical protein